MLAYRLRSESERTVGSAIRALFLVTLLQAALCSGYFARGAVANWCPLTSVSDSSSQTSWRQGTLGEDCWNRSLSWWGRWSFSLQRWEANSTERSHVHETRNSVRVSDLWDLFLRERFQPRWVEAKAHSVAYVSASKTISRAISGYTASWDFGAVQMQK